MGKTIDKFVLTALLAGAIYVFFMGALHSIPLSAGAAFLAMACLRKLSRRLPEPPAGRKRRLRRAADRHLAELALADHADAKDEVVRIIVRAQPSFDPAQLIFVHGHPSCSPLGADAVLARWRVRRGGDNLVIASTGPASEEARKFADTLRSPAVQIIDGNGLASIMVKHPELIPEKSFAEAPRHPFLSSVGAAVKRAHVRKCFLSAVGLLIFFLISGRSVYLAAAALLLFTAGAAFRAKRITAPRA